MHHADPGQEIAAIAARRASGWRLLIALLREPDEPMVEMLRTGTWQRDFRSASAWLGDSAQGFEPALLVLDALTRRAARRSVQQDLASLASSWCPPVSDVETMHPALEAVARECEAESAAWARGDHAEGKQRRVSEAALIEKDVVPVAPDWCVVVDTSSTAPTYRALARLLAGHLSVESGRDFDTALFPHPVLLVDGTGRDIGGSGV